MSDNETTEIERAAAAALAAANAWRGERWYEPADVALTLRLTGDRAPRVAGWEARLGGVEVAGAASAEIALDAVGDVFRGLAASRAPR